MRKLHTKVYHDFLGKKSPKIRFSQTELPEHPHKFFVNEQLLNSVWIKLLKRQLRCNDLCCCCKILIARTFCRNNPYENLRNERSSLGSKMFFRLQKEKKKNSQGERNKNATNRAARVPLCIVACCSTRL